MARRVYILGNPQKPEAGPALETVARFAAGRCNVIGAELSGDVRAACEGKADRIIVLGGDGTMIGVARSLGTRQIPLIGVNMGKLGYLAEYSLDDLCNLFDRAVGDDSLITRRMMLGVVVEREGEVIQDIPAVNDCVIQMGPPFRMIMLDVHVDGTPLTRIRGDGLIVCTPSGSTAHNLSAGGPIMQADVQAIGLTPLSPHSLTHRPLVIGEDCEIDIQANVIDGSSAAVVDGQVTCPLRTGDHIRVRRFDADFQVVRHAENTVWHNLVTKLLWGHAPGERA